MFNRPMSKRHSAKASLHRRRSLRLEQLEPRSLLATASLETFFGENGLVETPVPVDQGSFDTPAQMIQQPDGKLLAIGTAGDPAYHLPMLTRVLPNGMRDTSFGEDGVVILPLGPGSLSGVALQTDGKIVVSGVHGRSFIARLHSDGSPDTSFGDSGYLNGLNDIRQVRSVVVQPDGKLLAGGVDYFGDFLVTRFLPNGEVDSGYGDQGTARFDNPQSVRPFDFALQTDGKLVAGGAYAESDDATIVLIRFTASGQLDSTFGQAGSRQLALGPSLHNGSPFENYDLAIGDDDMVALVGATRDAQSGNAIAKVFALTKDGLPKTSFGDDGVAHIARSPNSVPGGIGVLGDGSIVVAGYQGQNSLDAQHFLAKLTSQGDLDPTWPSAGFVTSDLLNSIDMVRDLVVGADGQLFTLVQMWLPDGSNDLSVTNWLESGVPNVAFHGDGITTIDAVRPMSLVSVEQLLAHPSGGMMLFGQSGFWEKTAATAVRYTADGQLVSGFGQAGVQRFAPFGWPGSGTLQADGKLVLAVSETVDFQFAVFPTRYLPDGTVDPTFSVQRTVPQRPGNILPLHVVAQSDGKIVVVAIDYNYRGVNSVTRYLPDGRIDSSFGNAGSITLDESYGQVLSAVEHGGTLYLLTGGLTYDFESGFAVASRLLLRIDPTGAVDSSFGDAGAIVVDGPGHDGKLLIDEQNRLVAFTSELVKRYFPNGDLDDAFGTQGKVLLPAGTHAPAELQGIGIDESGNMYITRRFLYPSENDRELLRLQGDGTVDEAFSTDASRIIRDQNFIDYPGLLIEINEVTLAGTSRKALSSRFQLVRIRLAENTAWQNPTNPLNVDNDPGNHVVPLDALMIINSLHFYGPRKLSTNGPAAGECIST